MNYIKKSNKKLPGFQKNNGLGKNQIKNCLTIFNMVMKNMSSI